MSDITNYPGRGDPMVEQALTPAGGWKIKMDPGSNKPFFYKGKETTWDLKKHLLKQAVDTAAAAGGGGGAATPAANTATAAAGAAGGGGKKTFGGKKTDAAESADSSKPADFATADSTPAASTLVAAAQPATTTTTTAAAAPANVSAAAATAGPNFFATQPQQQAQQPQAYSGVQLSDPIQRLLDTNKKLVSDIAAHEAESITAGLSTFETRLDLLVHANNVLAVQLDRRNQEALAMQRALTEAHDTIHRLRNENKNLEDMRSLSYAHSSVLGGGGSNNNGGGLSGEEAKRSVAIALETVGRSVVHLQEQNRSLSATIAQLTAQLMQSVNSSAVARGVDSVQDQPHEWWKNSKGYSVAALTSRFLDSPARNALCAKCMLRISDFRDSLLREVPMTEAQREAQERRERDENVNNGGGGSPHALGGGGRSSGATPTLAGRPQPAYVPVNAFRPSQSAAVPAAARQATSPVGASASMLNTPKTSGGAFSAYR